VKALPGADWLQQRWYQSEPLPALLPLAAIYGCVAAARRRRLQAAAVRLPVPVLIVGNISVGGTGKTPLVIALVERLRAWGWRPGVISRGYGARPPTLPYWVRADGDAMQCGDEPLLIVQRSGVPLVIAPDRVAAAQLLIASGEVDVIIADDGLQHYRLARDFEIGVVDGRRGLGNRALLPAGPLREPPQRLHELDLVIVNGGGWQEPGLSTVEMRLVCERALPLLGGTARSIADFAGQRLHAVAGIGDPPRFFATLENLGIKVIPHAFADHHAYQTADLAFGDNLPVLMTEKDAVKCRSFADARLWSVPVTAQLPPAFDGAVREWLQTYRR